MVGKEQLPSIGNFIENYKISIILGLIGLIFIGSGILIARLDLFKPEPVFQSASEVSQEKVVKVKVDIGGAVNDPNVYDLDEGSRIQDAIEAAGGLSKRADKEWVSKNLNLAQVIGDGSKIYIPKVGEISNIGNKSGPSPNEDYKPAQGLVNINTATESELDTLPKIGPVTAQKIIDGRPYSSIEDLRTKNVLGPKTYEGLKDLVSVN